MFKILQINKLISSRDWMPKSLKYLNKYKEIFKTYKKKLSSEGIKAGDDYLEQVNLV